MRSPREEAVCRTCTQMFYITDKRKAEHARDGEQFDCKKCVQKEAARRSQPTSTRRCKDCGLMIRGVKHYKGQHHNDAVKGRA